MTAENVVIVQENCPSVKETRENDDGDVEAIIVEGLALPFEEQSRNGLEYTKESIKETADQMVGCSVLWNHDDDIPSLGKVIETEIKENEDGFKDGLYYTMELDAQGELESKVARKIQREYINNVSIQAAVNDEGLEAPKVAVEDWYELTICNIAGFPQTNTNPAGEVEETQPIELNGRQVYTEMAVAEKLGGKESQDDDGDDGQESDDGVNSNKNGGDADNDMSDDNDNADNGNDGQEQADSDVEEMLENIQETLDEQGERLDSLEEQVANLQESSDEDDDEDDDDNEENQGDGETDTDADGAGESKQGFDPSESANPSNSMKNRIAESLN